MKKIGVFTINDYNNYGNRLQNYATQEVLKSLGFSVETIVHKVSNKETNNKSGTKDKILSKFSKIKAMTFNEIIKKIFLKFLTCLHKTWKHVHKNKINKLNLKRYNNFKEFTSKFIVETRFEITDNSNLDKLSNMYDYFITGSDQVWNPFYRFGSSIDFLAFAHKEKRISYAASFGVSEIPNKYKAKYKEWLSQMYKLSVREVAGAKIIKESTGKDAVVLIDPTLMISKERWLSISKPSDFKPKKKYLLTYFLGNVTRDYKRKINKIAHNNKLDIVNLANLKDESVYSADPSEFIDFINSASVFCTDSYHGVVFSILLETPFIVFERIDRLSMTSRIDTLLINFKFESRRFNNIKTNNQIFNIDFSHTKTILKNERLKSYKYLKEALNIC